METRRQLLDVQRHVSLGLGMKEASIFDAHLLALEDPVLIGEVTRTINEERVGAEFAFQFVARKYIEALSRVTDAIRTRLLTKLVEKQRAEGKRAVTDADRRRRELPKAGGALE